MFWKRRKVGVNVQGAGVLILITGLIAFVAFALARSFGFAFTSLWVGPFFYGALLLGTLLTVPLFDRMPVDWVGLGVHRWVGREIGWGIGLGLGMATFAWVPSALLGTVEFRGIEQSSTLLYWFVFILIGATGEELLFRGYLFQRGIEVFGVLIATLLFSAGFALAHLGNPELSWLSLINTFIAGIFFSACYLVTEGLWLPIAAHVAWNCMLSLVLGLPTSGLIFEESLFRTGVEDHCFLTGGSFGPEGGIGATVALLLGGAILYIIPGIRIAPWSYARSFWAIYRQRGGEH
ncbi:MAG: CPBP family intramembrane metalloprotease [Chlorobi bacterium]|nr:CPBP family intramembrane metalloprotease [Chlorobiota bacterium]